MPFSAVTFHPPLFIPLSLALTRRDTRGIARILHRSVVFFSPLLASWSSPLSTSAWRRSGGERELVRDWLILLMLPLADTPSSRRTDKGGRFEGSGPERSESTFHTFVTVRKQSRAPFENSVMGKGYRSLSRAFSVRSPTARPHTSLCSRDVRLSLVPIFYMKRRRGEITTEISRIPWAHAHITSHIIFLLPYVVLPSLLRHHGVRGNSCREEGR